MKYPQAVDGEKQVEVIPFLNNITLSKFNNNIELSILFQAIMEMDHLLVFLMFCTFLWELQLCCETTVAETDMAELASANSAFGHDSKNDWSCYSDL